MIQLVASTRRLVAGVAAFALLAGLVPARSSAHTDGGPLRPTPAAADTTAPPTPPAPTPASDSTATPTPPVPATPAAPTPATPAAPAPQTGKKGKKAKAPKLTKEEKAAQAKADKEARAKAPKLTKQEKAAQAKSEKEAKTEAPKLTKEEKAAQAKADKEAKAKARAEKRSKSKPGKTAEPKTEKVAAEPKEQAKPAKAPKVAKAPKPAKPPEKSFEEQQKEDGIYAKRSNWLTFRFGYAKRTGDLTGDGFIGYGVGYQRMMTKKYAFAVNAGHDVVGHFQNQLDEAVPFTGEFQRHFKWDTALRPFVGLGGGYYLRKSYRTGNDYTTTSTGGMHLSIGFTSELDLHHVVGFEARVARLRGRAGIVNPTFGPDTDSETIWTAKLMWGLVY